MKAPTDEDARHRKAAIMQALQDQLESRDTPEVNAQYKRLRLLGYSESATRELMATILAAYLWHIMKGDDYTYTDFVAQLAELPTVNL